MFPASPPCTDPHGFHLLPEITVHKIRQSTRLSHECRFPIENPLLNIGAKAMDAWSLPHFHNRAATPTPLRAMSPDRLIASSWFPTFFTPTWAAWRITSTTSRSACCRGATRYDPQLLFLDFCKSLLRNGITVLIFMHTYIEHTYVEDRPPETNTGNRSVDISSQLVISRGKA